MYLFILYICNSIFSVCQSAGSLSFVFNIMFEMIYVEKNSTDSRRGKLSIAVELFFLFFLVIFFSDFSYTPFINCIIKPNNNNETN